MDLKIELRKFISGYYFAITYNNLFYVTEARIAELLGLNVTKYKIRLNKCLDNKKTLNETNLFFVYDEEKRKQYIDLFKEEFAPELTLLQIQ